jgi:hypothetical protein
MVGIMILKIAARKRITVSSVGSTIRAKNDFQGILFI